MAWHYLYTGKTINQLVISMKEFQPCWLVELSDTDMADIRGGLLSESWYQRWLNRYKFGTLGIIQAQRMVNRLLNEDLVGNTPTNNVVGRNWWLNLPPGDQFIWNNGVVNAINANVPPTVNYAFFPFF